MLRRSPQPFDAIAASGASPGPSFKEHEDSFAGEDPAEAAQLRQATGRHIHRNLTPRAKLFYKTHHGHIRKFLADKNETGTMLPCQLQAGLSARRFHHAKARLRHFPVQAPVLAFVPVRDPDQAAMFRVHTESLFGSDYAFLSPVVKALQDFQAFNREKVEGFVRDA